MRTLYKLFVLLALLGAARPAAAQYIGSTSPQTVQQTLATTLACTGAAQTFNIQNLGQTQHYLSIASVIGAQKFQAEIDAVDNQGNVLRISDIAELAGILTTRQGTLSASGYFPIIRAVITCSPGTATFTASYSGTSSTSNGGAGTFLTAQIDKINFFGMPANVNQQDNFQTPFGNSAGTLYFQYNTSSIANGTLSVSCNTNGISAATTPFSVTLANTTALQTFTVPPAACPFAQVAYGSPGGGTAVTAEYIFAVPGFGLGGVSAADPCASSGLSKSSAVVNATATTQLVSLGTGVSVYVCGFSFTVAGSATATAQLEYGTGATCGTGTTVLTGAYLGGTVPVLIVSPAVPGMITKAASGNALCLVAGGATPSIQGVLTYVQQSP